MVTISKLVIPNFDEAQSTVITLNLKQGELSVGNCNKKKSMTFWPPFRGGHDLHVRLVMVSWRSV